MAVFAFFISLVADGSYAASFNGFAGKSDGLAIGSNVPDFTLSNIQEVPFHVYELLEKGPVAIAFFRTDCSHCKVEIPLLAKLAKEEEYSSITFLAVNVREKPEVVAPFIEEHSVGFPVVLDSKMRVTRSYKVPSIPRLFFVKKGGVLNSSAGSISEEAIREHLKSLLHDGTGPSPQKVVVVVPSEESIEGKAMITAAKNGGYTPVIWSLDEQGPVTEAFLVDHAHDPVFRCIPDKLGNYGISRDEEVALLGYLSDGGKLVLSGNNVLKHTKDLEVIKYYVEVGYKSDNSNNLKVKGVPSDPDFGTFDITLKSETANGKVQPDVITPECEDAKGILRYKNAGLADECAAVLVKT
jgi:thiol-disulfide isomerase/thioredoxin